MSLASGDLAQPMIFEFPARSEQSLSPVDVGNVTRATITGLQIGRCYEFAVTAYDSERRESAMSDSSIVEVKR